MINKILVSIVSVLLFVIMIVAGRFMFLESDLLVEKIVDENKNLNDGNFLPENVFFGNPRDTYSDLRRMAIYGPNYLKMDKKDFIDNVRVLFYFATSTDDRWLAINVIKNFAEDNSEDVSLRAKSLNALIEFMFDNPDGLVIPVDIKELNEKYPDYQSVKNFQNLKERSESLFLLANFSKDLFPTSYANIILALGYSGSQKPSLLTADDKNNYGNSINEFINEALALINENNTGNADIDAESDALIYHFAGVSSANAELAGAQVNQNYKDLFSKAIDLSSKVETPNNLVKHIEPFSRFYFAIYEYVILGGEEIPKSSIENLEAIAERPSSSWQLSGFNRHVIGLFNLPKDQVGFFRDTELFGNIDSLFNAAPNFRQYITHLLE
jgi:hypothetical protein